MNQIKNLSFPILKRALRKYNQNIHTRKKTPVTRRNGFSKDPHFWAFWENCHFFQKFYS